MRNNICCIFLVVLFINCKNKTASAPQPIAEEVVEQHTPEVMNMDTVDKNLLLGTFVPSDHPDFVRVDRKYGDREGHILQRECYEAFVAMAEAAKKDDITLIIKSATRNHDYQRGIWERKWTGETKLSDGTDCRHIKDDISRARRILEYSSMPGSSRHHWGTDLDLNSFNNAYFEKEKGLREYTWLRENAAQFGFYQPYDDKSTGRTGYNEEKWHWSYAPLSQKYTRAAQHQLSNHDIKGFLGNHTAIEIDVLGNYILGVHSSCK